MKNKGEPLPPLPPHITVSEPKPPGKPLLRDDVYEVLRRLDSPRGVRVAQVVRECFDPEDLNERYSRCHQKVYERLRQLETDGRARRVGFTLGGADAFASAPVAAEAKLPTARGFSKPAGLWRAL